MKTRRMYWGRKLALVAGVVLAGLALTAGMPAGSLNESPSEEPSQTPQFAAVIEIPQGAQAELPVDGLRKFTVGAPNLLDAVRDESVLRLVGKQQGTTVLAVWGKDGLNSYQVRVLAHHEAGAALIPSSTAVSGAAVLMDHEQGATVKAQAPAQPRQEETPILPPVSITLQPGESHLIRGQKITRTSVSEPDIVDIVPVSPEELLVNAVKEGTATVRVWDDRGLSTYNITVARKTATPEEIAAAITQQIGIPTITARVLGDTVVLTGIAPTIDIAQKAGQIAEASGRKVLNLVTAESVSPERVVEALKAALPTEPLTYEVLPDQTVMMKGTVADEEAAFRIRQVVQAWIGTPEPTDRGAVSTRVSFIGEEITPPDVVDKSFTEARPLESGQAQVKEEFNVGRHVFGGRIANGPRLVAIVEVNPALARQLLVSAQVIEIDRTKLKELGIQWSELLGTTDPARQVVITEDRPVGATVVPLDEAGPFRRNRLSSSLRALITENAARILSEPKVLITDGHTAHILVGGELPIPIAQNVGIGTTSISVLFKPFGIQLTVRPKITQDNRILMTLTPEVSDLDFTNAVRAAGIEIPALTVRRTTTTVHVGSGDSLAIGGLLSSRDVQIVERVPLLSKIPIIGELFKSRNFRNDVTELIVLVTPEIIERDAPVPIPTPVP